MRVRNGVNKERGFLTRRQALMLKNLVLFGKCRRVIFLYGTKNLNGCVFIGKLLRVEER
jgi:hypothetical protein